MALAYGAFRIYPLLSGVQVIIYTPKDFEEVSTSTFVISGKALRANEIEIQGRPILIDKNGNFSETLVSLYPYTIITVEATDKYGGKVSKILKVIPKK